MSKIVKAKCLVLIGLILLLLPIKVFAASISNVSIDAPGRAVYKDTVQVSFNINFEGLDKNAKEGMGIVIVMLEFQAPNNILTINTSDDNPWSSFIVREGNTYDIVSLTSSSVEPLCQDGALACGDYKVTVDCYIKDYSASYAEIELKEVSVILSPIGNDNPKEKDLEILENSPNIKAKISISEHGTITNPSANPPKEPTTSDQLDLDEMVKELLSKEIKKALKDIQNNANIQTPTTSSPTPTPTTSNTTTDVTLKKLEVKDHEFEFFKDKEHYKVVIDKDTNSLEIKAEVNDTNATYEIIGADDLKKNEYQVKIIVSSGTSKKTYTIDALVDSGKNKPKSELIDIFGHKIEKRYLIYGGISLGVIILLIILKIILSAIKKKYENRKINRALKKLDK